jgi:hypothetical protein
LNVNEAGAIARVGGGFFTVRVTAMLTGLLAAPADVITIFVVWTPAGRLVGLTRTLSVAVVFPLSGDTISQGAAGFTTRVKSILLLVTLLLSDTDCAGGRGMLPAV